MNSPDPVDPPIDAAAEADHRALRKLVQRLRTEAETAVHLAEVLRGCERVTDLRGKLDERGAGPATTLVGPAVIDALGPDGMLVNVARGSVVDEAALVDALGTGRLGSAGLDVFADEPRVPGALATLPNVVLTPHQGSATLETRLAMGRLLVDNLVAFADGRPLPTPVAT